MKIFSIVGARPNFMKIAPFIGAIEQHNAHSPDKVDHTLIHTGQHYDINMSQSFFKDLHIPNPDINLEVGSGTHAEQVGNTMISLERVIQREKPDWVVVVGDVNATLAASVTAKKEWVRLCHIEAGLRSGDMKMPEEVNRLVTDRLADLLLTPDKISVENLKWEGVSDDKIKFVGNIMIDTLDANYESANRLDIPTITRENMHPGQQAFEDFSDFGVITIHRPSNVDEDEVFIPLMKFLHHEASRKLPLVWPVHPRTSKRLKETGLWDQLMADERIILLKPLRYHEMLKLNIESKAMLTDSGGLQEECTVLGTPCLTLRWNTERPVTLREHGGASVLVGNDIETIRKEFEQCLTAERKAVRPELWDGKTAGRCLQAILEYG